MYPVEIEDVEDVPSTPTGEFIGNKYTSVQHACSTPSPSNVTITLKKFPKNNCGQAPYGHMMMYVDIKYSLRVFRVL